LAPAGAHFLDQAELDPTDAPEAIAVPLRAIQKVPALFVFQNDAAGALAVNDSVFGRTGLPGCCGRPFKEGDVGFRRWNSYK